VLAGAVGLCLWLSGRWGEGSSAAPTAQTSSEPPWFEDVTDKVGLNFMQDPGPVGSYFMPQINGTGAALFDFDGDGLLDVYLLQGGGPDSSSRNKLFRQLPDHRFQDVSAGCGLDIPGFCCGVTVGDVNNDGLPDVLVTQYGGVRLFFNNGNGTFRDVTAEAGLATAGWATSAAFFDYDRDGWLDLVVVHYVRYDGTVEAHSVRGQPDYPAPSNFKGTVSQLYHNVGRPRPDTSGKTPAVRFEDVTEKSGLGSRPGPGLGVVCLDFDGDGWPDILIANDGKPNHLWINHHDGTFTEEAVERGLAFDGMSQARANMGIAVGDVDGEGLFSVFITHLTSEKHTLWRQGPQGVFHDRTAAAGLAPPHSRATGFGTVMADFNHDGWLDVAIVNGRVIANPAAAPDKGGSFWDRYLERNQLFANEGRGHFRDIAGSNPALCAAPGIYRGLAVGDLDGDGAPDLLVTAVAGPVHLLRNVAPNRGHWLIVQTLDPVLKRDAYGAEVTVEAGGRRQWRPINPASSFQCSNDPRAHFGLGAADRYERVRVLWPDGSEETFPGGAADRVLVLRKGHGEGRRP
jgi:hypothetical protein